MTFKKVDSRKKYSEMEEDVLAFWQQEKIFEKSVENRKGAKKYTFYDGPPFATGTPHYGHIVGQTMKDVVPRYWTMRGYHVPRRWGWDCHGLPIENIVEKELGSKCKNDIEKMGVAKFNDLCRSKVLTYAQEWFAIARRLGRWADMDNAYRTMDKDYMESIWWVFSELYKKGLVYEDYRSIHICPRCETTLSQSEVSEGYLDVKDLSVVAEFEILDPSQKFTDGKRTSILAWTTTPWTLPGNAALAVGKDLRYLVLEIGADSKKFNLKSNERIILLESGKERVLGSLENIYFEEHGSGLRGYRTKDGDEFFIVGMRMGSDLVGLRYKPLFNYYSRVKQPKVVLLVGPGGSGKTTIAEALHKKYGTTFIDGDFVTSQTTDPSDIWTDSRFDDLKKSHASVIAEAKKAFDRGENVVIDYIVYRDFNNFFEKCKDEFSDSLTVKVLLPNVDTIIRRDLERDCWTTGEQRIREVISEIEREELDEALFLDTANETIEETIEKHFKNLFVSGDALKNRENGWKVYAGDFVTTEDGTGVVHIAPAFGEDDLNMGRKYSLPFVQHVGMDGRMKSEVSDFAGMQVKPKENTSSMDVEIIKYLAKHGTLFSKQKYEHSYPHCWRCDSPLLNYATSSWFVAVSKIKDEALETAKAINWSPAHIKEGRFGKWLEGARDWSISRQRFWASVMPVWRCEGSQKSKVKSQQKTRNEKSCNHQMVFGSVAELEKLSGQKIDDLHKHVVDEITFPCEKCGGVMRRIPDVLDTWFDSGSMPYAQSHYPFENEAEFEVGFPAQFIAEGIDQTRAWFYYLHILATALKGKHAFDNVIVNGIVQGADGKKLSKKLKNYPDPLVMMEKYGSDALRFYLMQSPIVSAENLTFSEKDLSELSRGMFRMFWQSYSFFVMYANVDHWESIADSKLQITDTKSILDRWIVSRLNETIRDVNVAMESYDLTKATRIFTPFIDDLSNWYIRRSRKRFWKSEDDGDKNAAYATLHHVLVELSKLMAPFTPFIADEIYRNLMGGSPSVVEGVRGWVDEANSEALLTPPSSLRDTSPRAGEGNKESVHLEDYPQVDESLIDEKLSKKMELTRNVITKGLEMRASGKVKVRQPLLEIAFGKDYEAIKDDEDFLQIIAEEVNVKKVSYDADIKIAGKDLDKPVVLDLTITPELKLEGQAREIIRVVQQARKEAGFEVDDRIIFGYEGMDEVFENFGDLVAHEVLAQEVTQGKLEDAEIEKEKEVDGEKVTFWLKKK